jgi:hypothetical protein
VTASVQDVHELALGMPHVTVVHGASGNPVYQVGGRSFVFFRTPRPDAVHPETGERLPDVIVFWVESEADKQALVQDPTTPFFTTPHFDGHDSVLVQAGRLGEITRAELAEVVQDAWLARASARRRADWLAAHETSPAPTGRGHGSSVPASASRSSRGTRASSPASASPSTAVPRPGSSGSVTS